MVGEERTVRGSYIGSSVPVRDIPRYIDLYRRGKLPVDRLMGERLALEDINRGFDRLASGQALRDVVLGRTGETMAVIEPATGRNSRASRRQAPPMSTLR